MTTITDSCSSLTGMFCFVEQTNQNINNHFCIIYSLHQSGTSFSSTNSSLNEHCEVVGNGQMVATTVALSTCIKHSQGVIKPSGSVPFGSLENLGARLGIGGSSNSSGNYHNQHQGHHHRVRTTSFSSYRSTSSQQQQQLQRLAEGGGQVLQTRCNRSYHDHSCCLTKNKDIIKDERIVFVTAKTRAPMGIFSSLSHSSSKSRPSSRDQHHGSFHHHHHGSRFVCVDTSVVGSNFV